MVTTIAEQLYERNLDLGTLVQELHKAGLLDDAERARLANANCGNVHPLVYLAELQLNNARTGQPLRMDHLLAWLSKVSGQRVYQIDPLKINVGEIAEVMSLAFAQRHKILAVEVSENEVVIASAEPWKAAWENNLEHVLRKPIRRVLADPP